MSLKGQKTVAAVAKKHGFFSRARRDTSMASGTCCCA